MHISDPREVEEVLSFFRTHLGRELDIAVSIFEGITQYERMKVQEVDAAHLASFYWLQSPSGRSRSILTSFHLQQSHRITRGWKWDACLVRI